MWLTYWLRTRFAQELRDSIRRVAREQNETELTELASLQLKVRKQRTQKKSARPLPGAPLPMRQVREESNELARQLRTTDVVDKQLRAERVRINRVAAREQLRRERQLIEEARYRIWRCLGCTSSPLKLTIAREQSSKKNSRRGENDYLQRPK